MKKDLRKNHYSLAKQLFATISNLTRWHWVSVETSVFDVAFMHNIDGSNTQLYVLNFLFIFSHLM